MRIADNQSEWTPLQRNFLFLAAEEYEPDPPDPPRNAGHQPPSI